MSNKYVLVIIYSLDENFKFLHLNVKFELKECLSLHLKLETFSIYLMENKLMEADWIIPNLPIDIGDAERTLIFSPWMYFCFPGSR